MDTVDCKFEPEHRDEVCALLAALRPFDIDHFHAMSDADLIGEIRSLQYPFAYTGTTLERMRRLTELLQYVTEQRSPHTRTEYEYVLLQLQVSDFKFQRILCGLVGLLLGGLGALLLATLLAR